MVPLPPRSLCSPLPIPLPFPRHQALEVGFIIKANVDPGPAGCLRGACSQLPRPLSTQLCRVAGSPRCLETLRLSHRSSMDSLSDRLTSQGLHHDRAPSLCPSLLCAAQPAESPAVAAARRRGGFCQTRIAAMVPEGCFWDSAGVQLQGWSRQWRDSWARPD